MMNDYSDARGIPIAHQCLLSLGFLSLLLRPDSLVLHLPKEPSVFLLTSGTIHRRRGHRLRIRITDVCAGMPKVG